jgi:hypothetical protein
VREALVAESERAVAGLDMSRVWPRIDADTSRLRAQAAWRERKKSSRQLSRGVAWGSSIAAIAAAAALFLRLPLGTAIAPGVANNGTATPVKVAKRLPNHVYIDRLAGKDIAVKREPKSGTTMIWVHHEVDGSGW